MQGREQLVGVGLLLPCGLWGLNSDAQAWRQAPLTAESLLFTEHISYVEGKYDDA